MLVWGTDMIGVTVGDVLVWGTTVGLTSETTAWGDLEGTKATGMTWVSGVVR